LFPTSALAAEIGYKCDEYLDGVTVMYDCHDTPTAIYGIPSRGDPDGKDERKAAANVSRLRLRANSSGSTIIIRVLTAPTTGQP
jgi:hypothetical protein